MLKCSVVSNPESAIYDALAEFPSGKSRLLCFRYDYQQYYLPNSPSVELLALVSLSHDGGISHVLLGPYSVENEIKCCNAISEGVVAETGLSQSAGSLSWPLFNLQQAVRLKPISIAKPWGQEIWYTGIEARGQSQVTDGKFDLPLPWLLSLLPNYLTAGRSRNLNLLKILDPLAEDVFGDLYFELHEEKQEVYVVTHVDSDAWPSGVGGIRIGFDEQKRRTFVNDESFVQAFGAAVKSYEKVRRSIDELLDRMRKHEGIGLNEPVSAAQTKQWLQSIPEELSQHEQALRMEMDSFKATLPLSVGDVLKVPCYTPHSLLHGVRTIEFQTPVYERQILSFAQKVLTQNNWDTEKALNCMNLGEHQLQPLKSVVNTAGVRIEEVVSFSDFDVWRITLAANAECTLPVEHYALVIGVKGSVRVQGQTCEGEEACLIAANADNKVIVNVGEDESVVLVSFSA